MWWVRFLSRLLIWYARDRETEGQNLYKFFRIIGCKFDLQVLDPAPTGVRQLLHVHYLTSLLAVCYNPEAKQKHDMHYRCQRAHPVRLTALHERGKH